MDLMGNRCPRLVAKSPGPGLSIPFLHPPRGRSFGCFPAPSRPRGKARVSGGKCPCLEAWPRIAVAAGRGGLGSLCGVSFWGAREQGGEKKPNGCE